MALQGGSLATLKAEEWLGPIDARQELLNCYDAYGIELADKAMADMYPFFPQGFDLPPDLSFDDFDLESELLKCPCPPAQNSPPALSTKDQNGVDEASSLHLLQSNGVRSTQDNGDQSNGIKLGASAQGLAIGMRKDDLDSSRPVGVDADLMIEDQITKIKKNDINESQISGAKSDERNIDNISEIHKDCSTLGPSVGRKTGHDNATADQISGAHLVKFNRNRISEMQHNHANGHHLHETQADALQGDQKDQFDPHADGADFIRPVVYGGTSLMGPGPEANFPTPAVPDLPFGEEPFLLQDTDISHTAVNGGCAASKEANGHAGKGGGAGERPRKVRKMGAGVTERVTLRMESLKDGYRNTDCED
eukprot:evm.model.scf_1268.5 EVM.evm.TU.scf_1268.5   scf_1268:32853-35183(-)